MNKLYNKKTGWDRKGYYFLQKNGNKYEIVTNLGKGQHEVVITADSLQELNAILAEKLNIGQNNTKNESVKEENEKLKVGDIVDIYCTGQTRLSPKWFYNMTVETVYPNSTAFRKENGKRYVVSNQDLVKVKFHTKNESIKEDQDVKILTTEDKEYLTKLLSKDYNKIGVKQQIEDIEKMLKNYVWVKYEKGKKRISSAEECQNEFGRKRMLKYIAKANFGGGLTNGKSLDNYTIYSPDTNLEGVENYNESIKEGFNKGDKVQLKRKNNKIGIVKSIFNGDKDKNDKDIKYLDVEFEDGTKEGRPASDFRKVNEDYDDIAVYNAPEEELYELSAAIRKYGDGRYYINFHDKKNGEGNLTSCAGPYNTKKEAKQAMKRLRPDYTEIKSKNESINKLEETLKKVKDMEINEGMWASPFTMENAKQIAELLAKPITYEELNSEEGKQKVWNIIGDDEFWDNVSDEAFDNPEEDARYLIVKFLEDWMERKESFNNDAYSQEAENIIKKAIFMFNGITEDMATLEKKVDAADNDLHDIITSLENSIKEALE